jgi:hypothetical protein
MVAIIATAKEFSCRPSELLAIEDPVLALAACQRALEMRTDEGGVERTSL